MLRHMLKRYLLIEKDPDRVCAVMLDTAQGNMREFEVNGKVIRVCKTFFLNTLSISQTFVTTALIKKKSGGIVSADERGRHCHHIRVPDFVRDSVCDHISQFPIEESHYSRENI